MVSELTATQRRARLKREHMRLVNHNNRQAPHLHYAGLALARYRTRVLEYMPSPQWAEFRRWMKGHPLLTEFYRGGKGTRL